MEEAIKHLQYSVITVRLQALCLSGHIAKAPNSDLGEAQRGFPEW